MNLTIDLVSLANLTSEQFETVAFRLALLQGANKPAQAIPVERKAIPPSEKEESGERGPNEIAYLAHKWTDKHGRELPPLQRMRVGQIARPKFAEMGLHTKEEIAAACLAKGKPVGDFFTEEIDVAPILSPPSFDEIDSVAEQRAYDNF